jgi:hypothetical protein
MIGQKSFRFVLAASTLAACMGATDAAAFSCSAGVAATISRSDGGGCPDALSLNQEITLTYFIENSSFIDDTDAGVNNGDPVGAEIPDGEELTATLAQATSMAGSMQLPGVLTFVPVCPVGSSLNAGNECDPLGDECGTGTCGCQEAVAGVTCTASGANIVDINFGQDVNFGPDEELAVATVRVRVTDTVETGSCGLFFTRIDGDDVLVTDDADCDTPNTAGAQASANLNAPECATNSDCGDTECNECVDNACEAANVGDACGTDSDPDDCRTPACVDNAGIGECEQDQNDEPDGTTCDDGEDVQCTDDVCLAGDCVHEENNDFCDDADVCTADTCDALNDCVYDFICEGGDICRSPGYWGTHAGTAKKNSVNVAQEVIDAVGGSIEVCGQSITDTDTIGSLDSSLEGICVRVRGVRERQLYRQLVAATLNCALSGGISDCDTLVGQYDGDVSFDECNEVCEGNPDADPPSVGDCIAALDCFNNGGHIVDGECGLGVCSDDGEVCDEDLDCDQTDPQTCELFPNNCHDAEVCNEELGVCPKSGPAGSSSACKAARSNSCTIDDCN